MASEQKPFFVKIPRRGQLRFEGEDKYSFLQDIITNDIEILKKDGVMYSCLLSAHGKFLHDFIMFEDGDEIVLDCEGRERTMDLFGRFMMYRLRAKVNIKKDGNIDTYAILGDVPESIEGSGFYDPRSKDLGYRIYGEAPEELEEKPYDIWDQTRIRLGIPDGSRDMVIDRSNLIECNIGQDNGISFTKGCFVGQELTARMHNRGLSKKHLYPVEILDNRYDSENDVKINDKVIGTIHSKNGTLALASIKDAELENLENAGLKQLA